MDIILILIVALVSALSAALALWTWRRARALKAGEPPSSERVLNFQDPVTGLAGLSLFKDRLEHAVARTRRTGKTIAALQLEIEQFDFLKGRLGPEPLNRMLKTTAERLSASVRKGDTVAYLGDGQFALLLEDLRSAPDAEALAQKLRAWAESTAQRALWTEMNANHLRGTILTEDLAKQFGTSQLTVSAGLALSSDGGDLTADKLLGQIRPLPAHSGRGDDAAEQGRG